MSGNSKLLNQLFTSIGITVILFGTLSITASDKTVKVTTGQLGGQDKRAVFNKVKNQSINVQSAISTERKAEYKDISDPALLVEKSTSQTATSKIGKQLQYRDPNLATQLKSSAFFFSSAYVYMDYDHDNDGYYSEFTVNFDADTNYNIATVHAQLYLSFEGGPWELYFTSNYFDLDGSSSSDDYTVETLLTSGFPPGSYDILIDLYDQYDGLLVATIRPYDTYELAEHFLEDASYDNLQSTNSAFSIYDASITLLSDNDNDGFYQSFSLQFDADVDSGSEMIYAEIWVKDSSGNWTLDFTTEDFIIEGYSTLDTYILETVWQNGYSTGYYDFRVEIYDTYTDELLTTTVESSYQLSEVPLEDVGLDMQSNGSSVGSGSGETGTISVGSGGAGSMGLLTLLLMVGFLSKKKR
ncbi:MAG: hypothetical protein GY829_02030 [Gammaproteobacteria bacterium]|nr:hypothetical protein [Gammaproteobacteria bacterium]